MIERVVSCDDWQDFYRRIVEFEYFDGDLQLEREDRAVSLQMAPVLLFVNADASLYFFLEKKEDSADVALTEAYRCLGRS